MAQAFGISRSSYYYWEKSLSHPSKSKSRRKQLEIEIERIFKENKLQYGSPKIHAELEKIGVDCSRQFVGKIMRENNLIVQKRTKRVQTTKSNPKNEVACNLLQQDFKVDKPNEVWVSDITYIPTYEGMMYLVMVLDLFARKIVGWSLKTHMRTEMVLEALRMATRDRCIETGIMFHSDRGSQYTSKEFRKELIKHNFIISASGKGNCYDNAVAESFFSQLKEEVMPGKRFLTKSQAKREIFRFIEGRYNRTRTHSAINYKTPDEFENEYYEKIYKKIA